MSESVTFTARVEKRFRVFIPRAVREALDIQEGDYVEVVIRKVREGRRLARHPRA